MLPQLYEVEDYENCALKGDNYCKVEAVLRAPKWNTSLINELKKYVNTNQLDRGVIHRALCISNNKPIKEELSYTINKQLESYNLTADIDYHVCVNDKLEITLLDEFILILQGVLLFLVTIATVCDLINRLPSTGLGSALTHFSLRKNLKSRTFLSKSDDFKRLRCMQGVRFFAMLTVIATHVVMTYCMLYLKNPDLVEEIMAPSIVVQSGIFIVLPFFIMSSWLLVIQVFNIIETHKELSFKNLIILIINRYCRLLTSLYINVVASSVWIKKLIGPMAFDIFYVHSKKCKKNWWYSALYINNFLYVKDMCNPVTWYLAADFQLYLVNLVLLYVVFKLKINHYKAFGAYFMVSCFLHALQLYYFDLIFKPNPRVLQRRTFFNSQSFVISYASPLSCASCSCLGLLFGALYYKYKNYPIKVNQILYVIWYILVIILPVLVIKIDMQNYGRLQDAVLRSLLRPLFCLGVGVLILGMSFKKGRLLRQIFGNKYVVILSNFSFSTYLVHFLIIFLRKSFSLVKISVFDIVLDFIAVSLFSLLLGVIITLLVEEPLLSMQKQWLPKISKSDKIVSSKKN